MKGYQVRIETVVVAACLLGVVLPRAAHAGCGEGAQALNAALAAEEQALRATEYAVETVNVALRSHDTLLREAMAHPPAGYVRTLAHRLVRVRRHEVEPKRAMLERLRAQHEDARRQWERGRALLYAQLVEARRALQEQRISMAQFCEVREAHLQALRLYLQGMQGYRAGMDLYAQALNQYDKDFVMPYIYGFDDPQQWELLLRQLQSGDFLQDILLAMTSNVLRSRPPQEPPE
jgi:tetratricopeptide (TPR) repeat protein